MHRTVFVSSMLLLGALATSPALAQSEFKPRPGTPPPTPPTHATSRSAQGRERPSTRVAVGENAPDFGLTRIDGKTIRLSGLRGNWVMLWFVEDRDSLAGLDSLATSVAAMGVRTVAVCFEKAHVLVRHVGKRDLPYDLLADPTGDIVALYGLLDSTSDQARPGFVLVGPRGLVRLALLGQMLPSADVGRLVEYAVGGAKY